MDTELKSELSWTRGISVKRASAPVSILILIGIWLSTSLLLNAQSKQSTKAPADALPSHPRLLLNREKIASLKPEIATSRKFLWERYQQDIPRMIAVATGKEPLKDIRYAGDLVPELAFAWLMTGDDNLLPVAKGQLLKLTHESEWNSEESLSYLVPGHFLFGIALGYDWLYEELSPAERNQVAGRLGTEAERQYQAITTGRIWWRNQYFQNHSHSNTCGLAFAASALAGEDSRALKWLAVCENFFQKVFDVMPEDGGSLEGYAYGGYGGEYLLKYAMLARDLLGKDYIGNPWMSNFSSYLLHGLLPYRTSREWAMAFGDAPRRGWTSTAQHLFLLAHLYRDSIAQWMGQSVLRLAERGLGSHGWMMLIYYDPSVGVADPASFPTFHRFAEIDQVMMRSSWTEPEAMLIGFKCGPFMGKRLSQEAPFDYGTGHQGTDSGSFQIFANRQFWAIDPLYPGYKLTANFNTMLFKATGQLGEQAAFGSAEALRFGHYPEIVKAESTPRLDYVVGNVTRAYHPALGLKKFLRHLLFVKPDILLVADEVVLDGKGTVYNFPPETLQTSGGLKHAPNGYVVGPKGEASVEFEGVPGLYQLTAVYLDNVPGAAKYSFEVDGKTIYSWSSRNEDVDDHLVAVSPEVELRKGNRIAFCGASMAEGTRLIKLTAFSRQAPAPQKAEWLLQLDPRAEIQREFDRIQIALGGSFLDLYPLVPARCEIQWGLHPVKKPDSEPFTFRETRRITLDPPFAGDSTIVLVLLHPRLSQAGLLRAVKATFTGRHIEASWVAGGGRVMLDWDLEELRAVLR